MEKSKEIVKFSIMALVFVVFYFFTGNENAINNTVTSIILVGVATVITWSVIREQQKKGRLKAQSVKTVYLKRWSKHSWYDFSYLFL